MLAVEALRRVIMTVPEWEISWIAYNGAEAVEKCKKDKPDLILMDLIMPVLDGVQATCRIMKENPCAILVVTATVTGNVSKVFEAMGCGALDAVCTPVFDKGTIEGSKDLIRKVQTISKLIGFETNNFSSIVNTSEIKPSQKADSNVIPSLVVIGSSTGGPKALSNILSRMPENIGASIVIVQHVDYQFAGGLADWLNEQTPLDVKVIKEGMKPVSNVVYVAETNDHLVMDTDHSFYYTPEPINYPYRPSVNTFFKSVAANWQNKDIAVLLTGMGNDGAKGMQELYNAGWYTIAQDEPSSVVYGMPKAAIELGAVREVLSVDRIAKSILFRLDGLR
jgi:two-component system response regulator WspF